MNLIERLSLKFAIYREKRKISRMVNAISKQLKANPELKEQEVSEENKKISTEALQKIIEYKTRLGKHTTLEQKFLKDLNK